MNEEPKEEKKKTLGEINRQAYMACAPTLDGAWQAGAEAVRAEVLKEVQREIIADVANRAGMAALHVDHLHRLLDPLMAKLELPGMEYSSLTFAATEDKDACDSRYRWTASVRLGTGYSHGYGQTPEGAVNALLSKFGNKTTRESLDLAIANQREKLRNMEEQLAKLDGFAAAEAEATGGVR